MVFEVSLEHDLLWGLVVDGKTGAPSVSTHIIPALRTGTLSFMLYPLS